MKKLLLVIIALACSSSFGQDKFFCKTRTTSGAIQKMLTENSNQLSFINHGGLMNGGVCWWHSRFTRNATFLGHFQPDLPNLPRQRAS